MGKKHFAALLVVLTLFAVWFVMTTSQVNAIPSFARKYSTSCQTCHVAYPKLNAFGEAFRNNGYRFPAGDDGVIKDDPVSLGAPAWKRVWPESVWPSDIPGMPPVSLLVTNRFDVRPDDEVTNEFMFPNEIELLAGGSFGDDLSFYAALTLLDRNEFGGLHRLFGQFDSIGGTSLLNLKFGGFEPRAVPFSSHRRLTRTNYMLNNLRAGLDSALSEEISIEHGHGAANEFSFASAQRGVELWGVKDGPGGGGLSYAVGVVNGNGLGGFTLVPPEVDPHSEEGEHDELRLLGEDDHDPEPGDDHGDAHTLTFLDNNSSKDVYWRTSYKFFGAGLTGREIGEIKDTENWVDNSFRIGTFGVRGQTQGGAGLVEREDFLRYGVDFDLWYQDLNMFGAYMWGRNERPSHDGLLEFDTNSWFVQTDYVLYPWVVPALRYEVAEFDAVMADGIPGDSVLPSIRRVVPSLNLLVRANVRLSFEANHYLDDFAGNLVRFDIDFAF